MSSSQIATLAGTTWTSSTGTYTFNSDSTVNLEAPNGQNFPFNWAESSDGSGNFWMNESSTITNDKFVYIIVGSTNGLTGNAITVCSAPGTHTATPSPFTMTKQ